MGDSARVKAIVCPIAQPKLHRNGDIGADKPGCLEAADSVLQEVTVTTEGGACFLEVALDEVKPVTLVQGRQDGHDILQHNMELASRIVFDTPTPTSILLAVLWYWQPTATGTDRLGYTAA
jgi:hypothetical protein